MTGPVLTGRDRGYRGILWLCCLLFLIAHVNAQCPAGSYGVGTSGVGVCQRAANENTRLVDCGMLGKQACRVEVFYNNEWGTICDDYWLTNPYGATKNAEVVCRSLGLSTVGAYSILEYGYGPGNVWFDDVRCTGLETKIHECPRVTNPNINCGHPEDVGVCCQSLCTQCIAGKYNAYTGMESSSDCYDCSAGKYSLAGASECTRCEAGKYKANVGSGSCTDCGVNTYSTAIGATSIATCQSCPANSQSSPGSTACVAIPTSCPTGQYLSSTSCVACDAGKYKATTGTEACTSCALGKYSLSGVDQCTRCPTGKFSNILGAGECQACSEGKYQLYEGQTSCLDCGANAVFVSATYGCNCNAGYVLNSQACNACQPGKYMDISYQLSNCWSCSAGKYVDTSAATSCLNCPAFSTSAVGAAVCTCDTGYTMQSGVCVLALCAPGYTGPDGGTCTACVAGKYKTSAGSHPCSNCVAYTYSTTIGATQEGQCVACPVNTISTSGSDALADCLCIPGYTGPDGGSCTACVAGTYKATTGTGACTDCQASMTSPAGSTAASSCVCPSGTGLDAATNTVCVKLCAQGQYGTATSCEDCAVGKYKPGYEVYNTLQCTNCPTGSTTSFGGQTSVDSCKCVGQYVKTNLNPWTCAFCAAGQLKYSSTSNDCANCASTYWSVPGGPCQCNVGYTGNSDYIWFGNNGGSCSQCAAGKYKSTMGSASCLNCPTGKFALTGQSECTTCAAGKFGNNTGLSACFNCPTGSDSYAGTQTVSGCTCKSGFEGPAGGPCTAQCGKGEEDVGGVCTTCSEGKYKSAWGTQACIACPLNSQPFFNGQTCLCNAGYGGSSFDNCLACVSGKYSSSANMAQCETCTPAFYSENWAPGGVINVQSPIASTAKSQCFCPLNSYYYSQNSANDRCRFCTDANQITTGINTPNINGCLCKAGYRHLNQETCQICGQNQYSSAAGQYSCNNCAAGRVSPAGSTNISQCVCIAGWIEQGSICVEPICGPGTTGSGVVCTACPAGTFKATSGADPCTNCPANTYSTATSATSNATCSKCLANSASPAGSTASTSCLCNSGYTGLNGGPCTECQANFYKDTVGPAACTQCNLLAQSPAGSNSSARCICRAGYYGSNQNNCQQCASHTYSDTPGSLTCLQCPSNSEAFGLNDQKEDCKCNKGYSGPDGGTCTACNDTQYKDTVGSSPCSPCKANSFSGCKHSASCCACEMGYYGGAGQQCTICPADTYSDVDGASACTPCPANTSSPAGTSSMYSCECIPGHVGFLGYACEACVAGTYKQNDYSCAQCPPNTYSTQVAAVSVATCQACPRNSTSVAGSGSIAGCYCVAGYRQTAAHDACIACDPGYYDDATKRYECSQCAGGRYSASVAASGIEVCQDCPAGKWSPSGSPSCQLCPALSDSISRSSFITDCKCNAGATGADGETCIACEAGTYKEAIGSAACEGCPQFSQSLPGSDDDTDCKCNAGFTGDDGGPCSGCAEATYKSSVGSLSCTTCPPNAISPPESTKLTDCECDAGFAGADGETCSLCPVNTYKDELDPTICDDCPLHSQSPSGSALVTECKCNAGYTGANGAPCQACLAGTFKKPVGPEECLECPVDSSSPAGSSVCTCNPGYSGPDDAECTACRAGEYKEASGSAGCSRCPENSDSAPASTAQSSCLCNKGYSGPSEGPCAACEPGKYKPEAGSAVCESCPEHATPSSDSAAASCECMPGYRLADGGIAGGLCGACPIGTFKEQAGNVSLAGEGCFQQDNCCQCPPNRTTLSTGTVQSVDCLCLAGFGGAACQACAAGSYKTDVSMEECVSCPLGATTLQTRSSAVSDCVAAKGHYGNVTAGFAPCAGGSYAPTQGMQRCLECPPGATSPMGAEREAQCVCELPGWRRAQWDEAGECSCLPGYARNTETGMCQPCPADHYCEGGDFPAQPCPAASLSAAGSAERTDCVCAAGHSGEDGGPCAACAEGTWKAANGSASCTACAVNSLSPTASTDPEACLCLAGYTGGDGGPCTACETGKYKPELGAVACTACSANTTTHGPARTDASECVCAAGFGNESGVCRPCPAGRFKATAGTGECGDSCPPFSASPGGSASRADCVCNAGYSGDASNSSCEACPAGTHKASSGSAACVACAGNATTRAPGSTSAAECVCILGFAPMEAGVCSPCPANTFGLGQPGTWVAHTGGAGCSPCLANSFSEVGSDDGLDCLCEAGFEFAGINPAHNETLCSACPTGKYTDAPARHGYPQTCKQCPEHTTTLAVGGKSLDACVCMPGRHLVSISQDASSCEPCPVDSFKDSAGNGACSQCPANTEAAAGSVLPEECLCLRGFTSGSQAQAGQPPQCEACAAGKYKANSGSQACSECPSMSTSPPGSESIMACLCSAGSTGPAGGPCLGCPPDTYTFNGTCVLCPHNTESESGAPDVSSCKCLPGFSGPPGGPCSPCGLGYFRSRSDTGCQKCPANTNTLASTSTSAVDCVRNPGITYYQVRAPAVELKIVLPYALEYFTGAVLEGYKRGIAAAASKSCRCTITGEDVIITDIVVLGAQTGTRRLLNEFLTSNEIYRAQIISYVQIPTVQQGQTLINDVQNLTIINDALKEQGLNGTTEIPSSQLETTDIEGSSQCAPDTYKSELGNFQCTRCPQYSNSPAGSTSRDQCICQGDFHKDAGDGSCDRVCAPGFEAKGGAECYGCLPSHYKPNRGDEPCTRCPAFSLSFAYGQTDITSCLCEQGHIWNAATSSCDACPAGSFNNRVNDTACWECSTVCLV